MKVAQLVKQAKPIVRAIRYANEYLEVRGKGGISIILSATGSGTGQQMSGGRVRLFRLATKLLSNY